MNIALRAHRPGKTPDRLNELMQSMRGRHVAVVGLGKSGKAAVELLLRLRAKQVDVLDDKAQDALATDVIPLAGLGSVRAYGGGIDGARASASELVVVSPGVPRRGAWWAEVTRAGTPWMGEAELAWRCTRAPWLCVTGTNGKSTTTTMLGGLLQKAGGKTFVGGNLGDPVCRAAFAADDWSHLVVEMSSYQCEGISSLDATSAVLTNLTPDHLDRYATAEAYYEAKLRLFECQSPNHVAVFNAADKDTQPRARHIKSTHLPFNIGRNEQAGVLIDGRTLVLRIHGKSERYLCNNTAIRGAHNLENAAAAVAAARSANVAQDAVQAGLDAFVAVKHRLQEVGTIDGVLYVNDSKGTNVDATVKALTSFEEPIHLIAGGLDKGSSYAPMVAAASKRVKATYVIGQAAPLIASAMEGTSVVVDCGTMERALERAKAVAKPGEVVLLSPACASFDQFKNYEHRGEVFAAWVKAHGGTP